MHRRGEFFHHGTGAVPANAAVGHALAVEQIFTTDAEVLAALDEVAFQQHATDKKGAAGNLPGDAGRHLGLAPIVLGAVAMTAVNQQTRRQTGLAQGAGGARRQTESIT